MSKTTKILLIVLAIVIIAAAAFFLLKKPKVAGMVPGTDPNDLTQNNLPAATGGNGSLPAPVAPVAPPLATPNWANWLIGANGGASAGANAGNASNNWVGNIFGTGNNAGNAVTALTAAANAVHSNFPLKNGSRGNEVKVIQSAVNQSISKGQIRASALKVDGIWGAKTDAAVRQIYPAGIISFELYQSIAGRAAKGQGLK